MPVFFMILGALVLVGAVLYLTRGKEEAAPVVEVPEECCGQHAVCERDSLLAAMSEKVEYFDDEELDRLAGRTDFSPAEVEEIREVLLTLPPDNVAPWARSIQLRGITLPPEIRDELLLIVSENRSARTAHA